MKKSKIETAVLWIGTSLLVVVLGLGTIEAAHYLGRFLDWLTTPAK